MPRHLHSRERRKKPLLQHFPPSRVGRMIRFRAGDRVVSAKVVIFDIGGTLIGHHVYDKFADPAGDDPSQYMRPGALELMRVVAERGAKMMIVSNTVLPAENVKRAFRRLGFTDAHMLAILLSSDDVIGSGKPHDAIYEIAVSVLKQHRYTPADAVFVGDHYINDVKRPSEFRMHTIYLAGHDTHDHSIESAAEHDRQHATFVIHAIGDIQRYLVTTVST